MILATIIICAAMSPLACSEKTGYRAIPVEQAFPSMMACQTATMMIMPLIPHHKDDTFKIVCGGQYARIIGADI